MENVSNKTFLQAIASPQQSSHLPLVALEKPLLQFPSLTTAVSLFYTNKMIYASL